jgi:hypothetical protein
MVPYQEPGAARALACIEFAAVARFVACISGF